MSEIKRLIFYKPNDDAGLVKTENDAGEWCRYSDVAPIIAELAAAQAKNEKLGEKIKRLKNLAKQTLYDFATVQTENEKLREMLWLMHGCNISALYGDDGEKQCSKCLIDFKRMPVSTIVQRLETIGRIMLKQKLEDK